MFYDDNYSNDDDVGFMVVMVARCDSGDGVGGDDGNNQDTRLAMVSSAMIKLDPKRKRNIRFC